MTIGKVGMYGGKFLPCPHMGHVYAMIQASSMVDELHVIVSHDPLYEKELCDSDGVLDYVPHTMRVRWWVQLTKDMEHVFVHEVYDEQTGSPSDWDKGAEAIKKVVGKAINTVFSSEHSYTPIFHRLYPNAEHIVLDPERKTYPISGTALRTKGILKNWDMVPSVVRPYFVKKVVVVGTESCGKSTMVRNLANLFNTVYVEEFGRNFYDRLGSCEDITIAADYPEIAFEHKRNENRKLKDANRVIFIDTEAIVTQFFSMAYLGIRQPIVDEIAKQQHYDLWLFLEPDVKWVDDGTRSFGEQKKREENNKLLKSLLANHGVTYKTISGTYGERLEKAVFYVNRLLEGRQ
ncbi:multifunctional transcriptional regulator/nicotinamide-nucleotide adenylyltransferase/ribosylnicotinamide kinase NadR [Peribacillus glennii]|uniref:Multifunctional transcriptional regulator/nicotinamide-nucleotide adenylyltransferase/ribosylnicotinamide kinase NadR n=1 Tax=Peribacillus glennii TaxID=2303991 RepID=A0A372LAT8_9BACI|nr:multifunctional transcriptional regulator/nicotinamide-nucleotide adenylyltransferase/ribosylnicotinamide kinase NadR [Peribacillus glennii]RFU62855.1 multifunctional transcriptional regulator/nicotinamide-nucleotide adenylyltransferase/ribosylnicotinamide kinase NadR [Peribacillus glennii]